MAAKGEGPGVRAKLYELNVQGQWDDLVIFDFLCFVTPNASAAKLSLTLLFFFKGNRACRIQRCGQLCIGSFSI